MSLNDHAAFLALLAAIPSHATVHNGTVPAAPSYPYVLVRGGSKRPQVRGSNRNVLARNKRWRVTVSGLSPESVLIVGDQVQDVLEGARINGQRLEQLPTYEGADPLEDEDVKLTNGRRPFYAVYEWQVMS